MKLSQPSKYIELLLAEMTKLIQVATENYLFARYHDTKPIYTLNEQLDEAMKGVKKIQDEILTIVKEA